MVLISIEKDGTLGGGIGRLAFVAASESTESILLAQVLIDSVGLSRVFSYSVPEVMQDRIGIGSYVSIPLARRRSRGWVVGLELHENSYVEELDYQLLPVSRVLGGGPSPEVIALCKWAAWRFLGSPVHFMVHASPKKRTKPRPGGTFRFSDCEETVRVARGETTVVRIPPTFSKVDWIIEHLGEDVEDERQSLIVCPTGVVVKTVLSKLESEGFTVAEFPDDFEKAVTTAQIVVGTRIAVFASLRDLKEVIVIDPDDPSHKETSSPIWETFIVARARVDLSQRAYLLCSAPTLEMMHGSRILSLPRVKERTGWPKVMVSDLSAEMRGGSLLSAELLAQIQRGLGAKQKRSIMNPNGQIEYDGVLVLYNRLGGARALACSTCGKIVRCTQCQVALSQNELGKQGAEKIESRHALSTRAKTVLGVDSLVCPKCKAQYPPICTSCMATKLRVVRFGIKRLAAELEAATGKSVIQVDASSDIDIENLGALVLGTEAIFSRFSKAKMVLVADFDQYLFSPNLNASEQALSLVARVSKLLPPRDVSLGYVPLLLQSRDVENIVIHSVKDGDPRLVSDSELKLRKELGLPPFGALVRLSGSKAGLLINEILASGRSDIKVHRTEEHTFELRSESKDSLLDFLSDLRQKAHYPGIKLMADPT